MWGVQKENEVALRPRENIIDFTAEREDERRCLDSCSSIVKVCDE